VGTLTIDGITVTDIINDGAVTTTAPSSSDSPFQSALAALQLRCRLRHGRRRRFFR